MIDIGSALRFIRVMNQLKQFELADRLILSRSYLSELENGNRVPSLDVIGRYSLEFSIPVSAIILLAEGLDSLHRDGTFTVKVHGNVLKYLEMAKLCIPIKWEVK